MKKIIAILSFLLLPFMCFAQLRSQVCIIKQNYDAQMIETVKLLKPKLKTVGIEDTDKYIEDFIQNGSFGSGFVYVAPDGKNYIITNRHVIEDSKSVTVIFQNEEGEIEREYKDFRILAADAEIDVAILAFPEGEMPFTEGLSFSSEKLHDGDSVYTAGFPGLMGKPSWQFGAGIITNANVKSEELINPEISSVIQHSAQIDPGNSGGPLLIKDSSGIYKIVGINTWKVSSRQDTNFAVPIATVEKYVNEVLSLEEQKSLDVEKIIITRAESLQKILNKFSATFEEVVPFISMDYVMEEGSSIFNKVVAQCSIENRSVIYDILKAGYPVDAMKYAIGWYIFNTYHQYEVKRTDNQKSTVAEDNLPVIPTPIKYEDKDVWYTPLYQNGTNRYINFEWIIVNGGCQLYSCSNISKKDIGEQNNRTSDRKKYTSEIRRLPQAGVNGSDGLIPVYLPTDYSLSYRAEITGIFYPSEFTHVVDFEYKLNNFFAADGALSVTENFIRIYDMGAIPNYLDSVALYAGIQFQVPMWSPRAITMPYVTAQGGYKLNTGSKVDSVLAAQIEAGYRINIFVGKGNSSIFFDMLGCIRGDVFNFSHPAGFNFYPSIAVGIAAGYAF